MTTATSFHQSAPFLLVRPSDGDVTDVLDDEEEDSDARSVPPHQPPSAVTTTEQSLPSVIVNLHDLEGSEVEEALASGDVDTLLEDIAEHASKRDSRRVQTLPSIDQPPARASRTPRAVAIALLGTVVVVGAVVGLRAHHVSPGNLRAALHIAR